MTYNVYIICSKTTISMHFSTQTCSPPVIAGALPHLALEPWNPRNFGIRNLKDYPSILVW